jgi:hypothetical protein
MVKKPNYSVHKMIKKSILSWGIKITHEIPIYYKWDKRQPKMNPQTQKLNLPFFLIDYDPQIREWYISYFDMHDNIFYCTIDDITGTTYISNNDILEDLLNNVN